MPKTLKTVNRLNARDVCIGQVIEGADGKNYIILVIGAGYNPNYIIMPNMNRAVVSNVEDADDIHNVHIFHPK